MDKLLTKTKKNKKTKIENRDESTYNRRGNLGTSIAIGISKFSKNNQVTITRRNTAGIS
jgi:pullulanase/glycogen debranching enzyme